MPGFIVGLADMRRATVVAAIRFNTFAEREVDTAMRALHHAFRSPRGLVVRVVRPLQIFAVAFEDGDDEPDGNGDDYEFGHAMQPY